MARIVSASIRGGRWSAHSLQLRNYACLRYGQEYHNVARKTAFLPVRAFLLGRALELYLKAFLHTRGMGATELRKRPFSHKLDRLLLEAQKKDLGLLVHISAALRADVAKLNRVYASKALEYFSLLHLLTRPTVPNLERIFRFAVSVRRVLEGSIHEPT